MSSSVNVNRGAIEDLVEAQLARKMRQIASQVVDEARRNCPEGEGDLKDSIGMTLVQGSRGKFLTIRVGSDLEYAGAVEEGHDEYTIYPAQKQFLRFPKSAGGFAFVRSVTIPARSGVHYLRNALNSVMNRQG